jgi:hypothetical protein
MTFGHPIALFPAIGAVLLGGGAITTGALTASIAAGAFVSSLFSGPIGRYRWHGTGIQRSIQVFGAATAVFGSSSSRAPSAGSLRRGSTRRTPTSCSSCSR